MSHATGRADAKLRAYLAGDRQRTIRRPLGSRQGRIIAYARRCAIEGLPFPGTPQIRDMLGYRGPDRDIDNSLLGLWARGLIAPHGRGWRLTSLWADP